MEVEGAMVAEADSADQDRCLTSLVLSAASQAKSRLNQLKVALFIAGTAIQQRNHNLAEHKLVFITNIIA